MGNYWFLIIIGWVAFTVSVVAFFYGAGYLDGDE